MSVTHRARSASPAPQPPAVPPAEPEPEDVPLSRYPHSDLGNALCLVHLHCDDLRFVHGPDLWRIWSGRHWRDDTTGEMCRFAQEVAAGRHDAAQDLDPHRAHKERQWAQATSSNGRSRALLAAAANQPHFATSPLDYDRDPLLLNCATGLLDLHTAELRPHDRAALCSKLTPVPYQPDAPCPRWEGFLREVFQEDQELIAFASRLVGYLLTGDTREQAAFFLVGKGANGKTVFVETLRALLGSYAVDTPAATFLEHKEAAADFFPLLAARLVTASEGAPTQCLNETLFKRLTGGDLLTCRRPHRAPFSYAPTSKLLFATNEVPRLTSQSHALRRRVHILPFRQTFYAPGEGQHPLRDPALRETLLAELPGLLAWAVRGCRDWQQHGLNPPSTVMQETATLFTALDPLADFLSARCDLNPTAHVETSKLWQAYLDWCRSVCQPRAFANPAWFARSVVQRDGIAAARSRTGRYLTGLGLQDAPAEGDSDL